MTKMIRLLGRRVRHHCETPLFIPLYTMYIIIKQCLCSHFFTKRLSVRTYKLTVFCVCEWFSHQNELLLHIFVNKIQKKHPSHKFKNCFKQIFLAVFMVLFSKTGVMNTSFISQKKCVSVFSFNFILVFFI